MDAGAAIPRLARVAGSVVAPATLLTALLLYFGRLHVTGFFRYFGVNFTVLDLTAQDYLIRSADGLFLPVTVAAAAALALTRLHRWVAGEPRAARVARPAAAAAGAALLVIAVAALARGDRILGPVPEMGGLGLTGGVVLLAAAARLPGRGGPRGLALPEWAAAFALVSVGLFWAVGSYAIGVGTGRAEQTAAGLSAAPDAVLYSERSLSLRGPGIEEKRCSGTDPAFGYRYTGLKLVLRSGGQYFFLPASWTPAEGAAVLLPNTGSLRLEFRPPGTPPDPAC